MSSVRKLGVFFFFFFFSTHHRKLGIISGTCAADKIVDNSSFCVRLQRLPTFDSFVVDDNIKWDGPEYDFMEDAKKMLKEYEEEEARLAALQPRAVVDTAVGDTDDW